MDLLLHPSSKVCLFTLCIDRISNNVFRVSTANGYPPPFLQHNDTKCKENVKDALAPELMTLFELQKFSNRLHTAMAAQISSNNGVSDSVVRTWEDELELLKPIVTHVETGKNKNRI